MQTPCDLDSSLTLFAQNDRVSPLIWITKETALRLFCFGLNLAMTAYGEIHLDCFVRIYDSHSNDDNCIKLSLI